MLFCSYVLNRLLKQFAKIDNNDRYVVYLRKPTETLLLIDKLTNLYFVLKFFFQKGHTYITIRIHATFF